MIANWPLIGRQEELSLIERTLSDDQFRGLLLAGAPRVGKTRLARASADAAARKVIDSITPRNAREDEPIPR